MFIRLSPAAVEYRARTIMRCLEFMHNQVLNDGGQPYEFDVVRQRTIELMDLISPLTNEDSEE